jgi:2-polyprenyl-6-methoxyphenol hydroxylase-like FAD-dependent oxidoreductase
MRVGIIGGSIAGCAAAALLHQAGHDVIVFERSESELVSRGAGIVAATAAWQDMMALGLIDGDPSRLPGRLLPVRHPCARDRPAAMAG